jgi:hypothetical protein
VGIGEFGHLIPDEVQLCYSQICDRDFENVRIVLVCGKTAVIDGILEFVHLEIRHPDRYVSKLAEYNCSAMHVEQTLPPSRHSRSRDAGNESHVPHNRMTEEQHSRE